METAENLNFSIIIPVYNAEEYLKECLDSIANQTLKDFEVICVNDGSTDNCGKILQEYASKDRRFVIIEQENQGTGIARNNALYIAKGEYIVFVDPDDWLELNALEDLYTTFNETGCEVIQFNYTKYYEYSKDVHINNTAENMKKLFNYSVDTVKYYNWHMLKSCVNTPCCFGPLAVWDKAYSKTFLDKADALFAPSSQGEDHLFSVAVILNAEKITYLDKSLYNYRLHAGSATHNIEASHFAIFKNIELLENYLREHNLYNTWHADFCEYRINALHWHYKIPKQLRNKYLRKCRKILSENEYKKFKKSIPNFNKKNLSPVEHLFSVTNKRMYGEKYKVITILGLQFAYKTKSRHMP